MTTVRDPVSKSYRKMVEGMDLFEREHARAPAAELRYRLLPRKRDTRMSDIQVEVVGDSSSTPVLVAPDGTFTLERDQRALAEDAAVRPNRRSQTMTWRADIRSPGTADNVRRLGDLRLECEVGMTAELVSNRTSFERMADALSGGLGGYCSRTKGNNYLFFAERPIFGIVLVSGNRREEMPLERLWGDASDPKELARALPSCDCEVLLDRTYTLPLGDRSWPDDTRVELEYVDPRPAGAGKLTKSEAQAALGEAKVVRFESGYEAWVYRNERGDRRRKEPVVVTERVLLFSPEGTAVREKTWTTSFAAPR